ncbi:hypothetical protein pb186bvf_015500 [Paramecium bursaria]
MLHTLQYVKSLNFVLSLSQYLDNLNVKYEKIKQFAQETILILDEAIYYPINHPNNFLFQQVQDTIKRTQELIFSKKLQVSQNMEELYRLIGSKNMDHIFNHTAILIKIEQVYIQINGPPIMNVSKRFIGQYKIQKVQRQKILYCNHMSRQVGMFKKSILGEAYQQIKVIIGEEQIQNLQAYKLKQYIQIKAVSNWLERYPYPDEEKYILRPILERLMHNMQTIQYYKYFKLYCSLPSNYKDLKTHDELYANFTTHDQVIKLLKYITLQVIPPELFGRKNRDGLISCFDGLIKLKRYEDQLYIDYLQKMNVFEIPWLKRSCNKKHKQQLIKNLRRRVQIILILLLQQFYIPFLRHNFYITERHGDDWVLYYYRKEIWHKIIKLSIKKLVSNNYVETKKFTKKEAQNTFIGKLRILPKPGTFRPITTYQRKVKELKKSLNQKLFETKLVLRNLKNDKTGGYSVFDNKQVFERLEQFVKLWKTKNYQPVYFLTTDISKCYDSIELDTLMKFLEQSNMFDTSYIINKYLLIQRNKRPLSEVQFLRNLFNINERTCAIRMSEEHPTGIQEKYLSNAIIIHQRIENSITIKEVMDNIRDVCNNNIVQFQDKYYKQTLGIPQGLNISGILCSFYLSQIEKQFEHQFLRQTLIMRLTDDYCCLTLDENHIKLLKSQLSMMEKNFKLIINLDKTKSNFNDQIEEEFDTNCKWIGKSICVKTMQITPLFQFDQTTSNQSQILKSSQCKYPIQEQILIFKEQIKKPNHQSTQILLQYLNQYQKDTFKKLKIIHKDGNNQIHTLPFEFTQIQKIQKQSIHKRQYRTWHSFLKVMFYQRNTLQITQQISQKDLQEEMKL